jgi:hypothetical protein
MAKIVSEKTAASIVPEFFYAGTEGNGFLRNYFIYRSETS